MQVRAALGSTAPPLRVAAAPTASIAPAAVDARWDPLLVCVAGYIVTAVGRVHQLFPVLGVLRPAILTGLFAVTLYLFDRHEERRASEVFLGPMKFMFAFLFWMILCLPGALVLGNSVNLVFGNVGKTIVMSLVLAGAVRGLRDVERLITTYLVAAAAYAVVVVMRFDLGEGADWRLGHLYYYDANDLATFLVTAMPFGIYFLHAGRRPLGRLMAAGALLVVSVAFVRTGSRGGFIALIAVAAWVVLRYSAIPLGRRIFVTLLVAGFVMATASDRYWDQMTTIVSDTDYNRTQETGRLQIWTRGLSYMLRHPLFGVGPDNFQTAEGTLSPLAHRQQFGVGVRWNAAHNTYIQVGAEVGVVGLVLFVAMLVSAFVALHRSRPRDPDAVNGEPERLTQLRQVLTASLIGFVVGASFLSLAYTEMLYILVALVAALRKVATSPGGSDATALLLPHAREPR